MIFHAWEVLQPTIQNSHDTNQRRLAKRNGFDFFGVIGL